MKWHRIATAFRMSLNMLLRRRIVLIALSLIPLIFLSVVQLTAAEKVIQFQLASLDEPTYVELVQRGISLIFFSVTSTGFLTSFLALNLIQLDFEVNRRLVIGGYHPVELLLSKAMLLLLIIGVMATYMAILIHLFYPIRHFVGYVLGLSMIGFVYGCYGLAIGSVIHGELEGIFLIVLLANIDVGWVQNPVFFADAQNREIIKYLPGYFPSQAAIISALTDYSAINARLNSFLYGTGFFFFSLFNSYKQLQKHT
jgi:hypothetical protein